MCAVFRDEAEYLDEWLTFHSYMGVDKFYLYNDSSSDNYREVLKPWIEANKVQLLSSKGRKQKDIYNHCIRRRRFETRWLALIDIDEFLWSPSGKSISELLSRYEGIACLMVRWVLFGSSGKTSKQKSVLESYTQRLPLDAHDWKVIEQTETAKKGKNRVTGHAFSGKSIINPRRVFWFRVHLPIISIGRTVDELWQRLVKEDMSSFEQRRLVWARNPAELFRINHYWSKSIQELEQKVLRAATGSFHKNERIDLNASLEANLNREKELNIVMDDTIQKLWEVAKSKRSSYL